MHLEIPPRLQAKEEGVSLNMLAATLLAEGIGKKIAIKKKSGFLGDVSRGMQM